MQLFYQRLAEGLAGPVDNHVDTLEVVDCFYNIVYIDRAVFNANGVGFVDVSGLVMGESAALYMVGVVGQLDLYFVVDPAFGSALFFRF